MTTSIIRVLIIFIVILFVFRLMGKRQIGQMQPFELVITLIIADLATIPMAEIALPLLNGIVPLLSLVLLQFIITFLSQKSTHFTKLVSGKPIIVVDPSGINYPALKKLNITIDDLFEAIRGAGFFNFSEVEYAIMETNGKLSVMPKSLNAPVTAEDLQIKKDPTSIPLTIIVEGKFMEDNLKLTQKSKDFFYNILKEQKIQNEKTVLLLSITKQGDIYLQEKNKPFKCLSINV